MPLEDNELDWQKIMEIGARSLGGGVASAIISEMFGHKENTQELITQAIEEICERMTKIVDNAFMQEYIADTNSIASRLAAFEDSNDVTILDELFADASDTVHHLRRFDTIESITACNYISTIHLVIIQAMSEHNSGYRETLSRTGKEYAEWSKSKAGRIGELTKDSMDQAWPYILYNGPLSHQNHVIRTESAGERIYLVFRSIQPDKWTSSPTIFDSEPIILKDKNLNIDLTRYLDIDPLGFGKYTVNASINEDMNIKEKVRIFNEELSLKSQHYMNERITVSDAIESTILEACDKWNDM